MKQPMVMIRYAILGKLPISFEVHRFSLLSGFHHIIIQACGVGVPVDMGDGFPEIIEFRKPLRTVMAGSRGH